MSKAFTKEDDGESDEPEIPTDKHINYVTPVGLQALQDELKQLLSVERPKIVETVSWAAKNGDRSENGDYIYGKRRLREIDRRIRYLTKRLDTAKLVNPSQQQHLTSVFFGATVTYKQADGLLKTVKIVGIDEADIQLNKISWISPIAKALLKSRVGDTVTMRAPESEFKLEIIAITYQS